MFGAVTNRTYRAWGKYRITDLFSETSSSGFRLAERAEHEEKPSFQEKTRFFCTKS